MIPAGLELEIDFAGECSRNFKRQTGPLVTEGAPTSTNPKLSDSNRNLVLDPKMGLNTKTD
jgi:hypothetical protein